MKGVSSKTGQSVRFVDRAGTRNGRLLFVECLGTNKHKHSVWRAVCDCGGETTTSRPHATQSCGCLQREKAAESAKARAIYTEEERQQRAKQNAIRQYKKRQADPRKAMQTRISRLHRHALSQVCAIKTSSTFAQLGYSVDEFVQHIERQFREGMSWESMHLWQIDHIIPISTAKTIDDVIALNQLSNLRPLWAKDNNSKKDKVLSLL